MDCNHQSIESFRSQIHTKPALKDLCNTVTLEYGAHWKEIGTLLTLRRGILDMIEKDHQKTEDRCNDMWREWLDYDTTASWGKILEVIEKIPYCNVAPCTMIHSSSLTDSFSLVLHETKAQLQKSYQAVRYIHLEDDWPRYQPNDCINIALIHHNEKYTADSMVVSIQEVMHNGEITLDRRSRCESTDDDNSFLNFNQPLQRGHFKSYKYTRNLPDIFSPVELNNKKTNNPYMVLIEGAPGIGKTILSKEIANLWANGELFKDNLFFMLRLRDSGIQKITSFSDLAKYIIYSHAHSQASSKVDIFTKYFEQSQGEDITILLDGFDEFAKELRDESFIASIIYRNILPFCNLIITSRPTASARLHERADRRVEILGFTDEDRKQYIQCALRDSPKEIEMVTAYLKENPFINTLCYIPLNMSILICILKESNGCRMPRNQTEINNQFICMTISRHLMREKILSSDIKSLSKLPSPYNKQLAELSKLAFTLIGKDKVAFSSSDIEDCCPKSNLLKDCINNGMGLLQVIEYYNFTDCTKQKSFNFLHFSIQEFLAAFYVTSLSQRDQTKEMRKIFWDSKYLNMWVMYVGLTGGGSTALKDFLAGKRRAWPWSSKANEIALNEYDDKVKYLYLFHCFLEAGNDHMCQKVAVGNLLEDKIIDLSYTTLLRNHMHTLGFFITRSATEQWQKLNLSKCSIRDGGCEVLSTMISNSRVSIESLDLSCNQLTPSSLQAICNLVKHFKLQELKLSNNNLTDADVSRSFFSFALFESGFVLSNPLNVTNSTKSKFSTVVYLLKCNFLTKTNSFKELNLIDKLYVWNSRLQCSNINEILNSCKVVKKISIFESGLTDNECDETFSMLNSIMHDDHGRIDFILLSKNKMVAYNSDKHQLTQILQQKTLYMTVIQLNNCLFTTEMLSQIGTTIVSRNNVQWTLIDLSECGIQDVGYKALFDAIFASESLVRIKTLNLSKNFSTTAIIPMLVESLECCVIEELIVSVDDAVLWNSIAATDFENKVLNLKLKISLVILNNSLDKELKKMFTSIYLINHDINYHTFENIEIFLERQKIIAIQSLAILKSEISADGLSRLVSTLHPSSLYICKCDLLEQDAVCLTNMLEKARVMRYILCAGTYLFCYNTDVQEVINTSQYNTSLNNLHLINCSIPSSCIYQLGSDLAGISGHWETIDFSGSKVDDHSIALLYDCFSSKSKKRSIKVESLNLSDNNITNVSARKISDLAVLWHVRQLNISYNSLNDCKVANAFANSLNFAVHSSDPSVTKITNSNHMTIVLYKCTHISERFESYSHAPCNSVYFVMVNCDISDLCILKKKMTSKVYLSGQNITLSKVKPIVKTLKEIAQITFQVSEFENPYRFNNNEIANSFNYGNIITFSTRLSLLKISETTDQSVQIVTSNIEDNTEMKVHCCKGDHLLTNCLQITEEAKTETTKMTQLAIHNVNIDSAMINEINALAKTNYQLECVAFSNNNLHDEGLEKVTKSLRNLPLNSITINNSTITDKVAEHIAVIVADPDLQSSDEEQIYSNITCINKTMPLLTHLNLSSNFITDKAAEILANAIVKNTVLHHLDLSNCKLQKQGLLCISQSLIHLSSLRYLALNSNTIPIEIATQLAKAILKITKLENVQLQNCKLQGNGALVIFASLKNKVGLNSLDVSHNKITVKGASQLSRALYTITNTLTHIKLISCKLKPSSLAEIFDSLQFATSLVCLDVSSNTISIDVAYKLSSLIDQNCNLEILNVANCALQRESFLMIMNVIKASRSIQQLNISSNIISGDIARSLDIFLTNSNSLKHLELSDCRIHEHGLPTILENVQRLSYLDLSFNKISDEAAKKLAISLKNNVTLEFLSLAYCHLQEMGINSITLAVRDNTSLKALNLSHHIIDSQAANYLSYLIITNALLRDLDLSHCTFSDNGYDVITNVLRVNPLLRLKIHSCKQELKNIVAPFQNNAPLRNVNLENIDTSKSASKIAQLITNSSTLVSLKLSHCNLKTAGILRITDALSKIMFLKVLDLSSNPVIDQPADGIAIANGIASVIASNCQLEYLNLSDCKLSQTGMIEILRAVKNLIKLDYLSLKSNEFNDRVAENMAVCLKYKKVLRHLDLSYILDSEILIIANSLNSITSLEHLGLEFSNITNEAANLIASVITSNSTLQHLNVSNCNLQEEGIIMISKALGKNNSINKLLMNSNSINDTAACELAITIAKNSSLESLGLSDCELEEIGLIHITKALKCTLLKELDLSCNIVSNEVARYISDLCDSVVLKYLNLSHCGMLGAGISMIRDTVQDLAMLNFDSMMLYKKNTV
ncbi:protein NLRC5-like [Dysidea avara]|uniref:protein NLRC5-like n=1 Tax=Dysidea avara TaxID=196820 RepID=UPI00332D2146